MIYYARVCCRIEIGAAEDPGEVPADEILATEPGDDADKRRWQFRDDHVRDALYRQSPALLAHIRALDIGHSSNRLVDTEAACVWTGRKPEVLYRWAREERVTRHKRGHATLWDLFELPRVGEAAPPRRGA